MTSQKSKQESLLLFVHLVNMIVTSMLNVASHSCVCASHYPHRGVQSFVIEWLSFMLDVMLLCRLSTPTYIHSSLSVRSQQHTGDSEDNVYLLQL